jgi:hypothetical protein
MTTTPENEAARLLNEFVNADAATKKQLEHFGKTGKWKKTGECKMGTRLPAALVGDDTHENSAAYRIEIAKNFISKWIDPQNKINTRHDGNCLKHTCEEICRHFGNPQYVSEADFVFAALTLGYKVKASDHCYTHFNMNVSRLKEFVKKEKVKMSEGHL